MESLDQKTCRKCTHFSFSLKSKLFDIEIFSPTMNDNLEGPEKLKRFHGDTKVNTIPIAIYRRFSFDNRAMDRLKTATNN